MKLATRISLFFVIALAIVLAGFSGSVYWIVRAQSYSQMNARLAATLDTICAAVESGPDGLEWEPGERILFLNNSAPSDSVIWDVVTADGKHIDGSKEPSGALVATRGIGATERFERRDIVASGGDWRLSRRAIQADAAKGAANQASEPGATRYKQLIVTAATPLAPVQSYLRNLAVALLAVSVSIWTVAAILGRFLCQRALAPLTQMSAAISTISAADLDRRIPLRSAGDELDELGRAFNQLLNRLQASFARQTRFAAEASHQLRTPLTAMIGQVEVALRRERPTFEYRAALENVRQNCEQLRRIIESLLILAREDTDAALQQSHRIDLSDWLTRHLAGWSNHPRFADVRLEVEPQRPLVVAANDALFGQALDNLLDNACKYSEPQSEIEVRAARVGDHVILSVKDHGRGIAESELSQVRDPFFRSDDVRRLGIGGSGLGLSVVQRIVDAFGATLSITSQAGRFSIVSIKFKALASAEEATRRDIAARRTVPAVEAIGP